MAVAMGLGTLLSSLTGWQFVKLGRTFTNRASLAYTRVGASATFCRYSVPLRAACN